MHPIHPRSLLSILDLSLEEISAILSRTSELEQTLRGDRTELLRGRTVALLFYESSTRTRTSFELAAKQLGATTTLVSDKSSSIEKGESLKDTGLTLRALGAEAIILRHNSSGAPWLLAQSTGLPVLNAGDGTHEHPSQALLDLRTMLQRLALDPNHVTAQTLAGRTIAITGDILHSRVARSNALLLPRLGARVLLCGPQPLLPADFAAIGPGLEITRDFHRAIAEADILMQLRIQRERLQNLDLDLADYTATYQLNALRLQSAKADAVVLHPGPMIRGLEITSDVADSPQSAIEQQVTNGLSIRAALLARALSH